MILPMNVSSAFPCRSLYFVGPHMALHNKPHSLLPLAQRDSCICPQIPNAVPDDRDKPHAQQH
jgi:hypothetical protein